MIHIAWTREELIERVTFWKQRVLDIQNSNDPNKKGKLHMSNKQLAKMRLELAKLDCP